ncbi:hypothetical protein P8918_12780 [Bacillus spizizenii]|nr:hypothetical protein [Bacillus spizizenii]MCY8890444.1 hypothetical protein [Bacillus spizizenii]MEC0841899.1 hypothetical protein [Bacillus spizizenii]
MAWYLITVQKDYVAEPAQITPRDTSKNTMALEGEIVIGQYKHGSGTAAMEDAAAAHGLSPFVLNYYELKD